ncbi:MAG: DoxX family protein [Alphaproteobacteria bacterium]|nr:DoxX family protein [Alphaproteobacteria bacterium]
MPAFVIFGRFLFAVFFIYVGATQLLSVSETAAVIAAHVAVPEAVAPYATQLEQMTGMTTPTLLAIASGALEVIAGVMIMLNFGVRFFAFVLIAYLAVNTYFFADFWNQAAPEKGRMLLDAMKNVSLIGALCMIIGYGRGVRPGDKAYSGY